MSELTPAGTTFVQSPPTTAMSTTHPVRSNLMVPNLMTHPQIQFPIIRYGAEEGPWALLRIPMTPPSPFQRFPPKCPKLGRRIGHEGALSVTPYLSLASCRPLPHPQGLQTLYPADSVWIPRSSPPRCFHPQPPALRNASLKGAALRA